jgi:lipopolysaccharide export system permease protein
MRKLDRHIAYHVLAFTAVVAFALLAIQTFIAFVAEADDVSESFGFSQLLLYIALRTPSAMLLLLPIVALLGTLLGLGALASQGELVAMRAAGVSILRIGAATLGAGVVLALLSMLLANQIAPAGEQAAERLRSEARYGTDPGAVTRPVWLRSDDQIYQIRRLLSEREAERLTVYTLDEALAITSIAEVGSAVFEDGQWHVRDVTRTTLSESGTSVETIEDASWSQGPTPEVLELIVLEADSLSLRGLHRLIAYLDANNLDARAYRLSLWRKYIAPLTVMAMMLIAVPYVLGSQRDSGVGQRLLVGVLVGLGFWVTNELAISAGQIYAWPPWLAASLPTAGVAGLATWRLARFRS